MSFLFKKNDWIAHDESLTLKEINSCLIEIRIIYTCIKFEN